jgi:hypothetical protein
MVAADRGRQIAAWVLIMRLIGLPSATAIGGNRSGDEAFLF